MPNDRAKSGGTITPIHTWRSIWPLPHSVNKYSGHKETQFLLKFFGIYRYSYCHIWDLKYSPEEISRSPHNAYLQFQFSVGLDYLVQQLMDIAELHFQRYALILTYDSWSSSFLNIVCHVACHPWQWLNVPPDIFIFTPIWGTTPCYLKLINTFLKNKVCILSKLSKD